MSNVHYAVFVNGSNPSAVGAMVPSMSQIDSELSNKGIDRSCGCSAFPVRTLLLVGDLSGQQRSGLEKAIHSAWEVANAGMYL